MKKEAICVFSVVAWQEMVLNEKRKLINLTCIRTSNNQIVHHYIVSLAIVSHAVFDANSAVGFVYFL